MVGRYFQVQPDGATVPPQLVPAGRYPAFQHTGNSGLRSHASTWAWSGHHHTYQTSRKRHYL